MLLIYASESDMGNTVGVCFSLYFSKRQFDELHIMLLTINGVFFLFIIYLVCLFFIYTEGGNLFLCCISFFFFLFSAS
jgi:hypothetical protein